MQQIHHQKSLIIQFGERDGDLYIKYKSNNQALLKRIIKNLK